MSTTLVLVFGFCLLSLMVGVVAWYVWGNGKSLLPWSPAPMVAPSPAAVPLIPSVVQAPSPSPPWIPSVSQAPSPAVLLHSPAPSPAQIPSETYEWKPGSWGGCELSGQWCNRYRSMSCADSQGRTVPNDQCPGWMPSVKESCNYPERSACYAGKWVADGDFGPCKLHNIVIDGRRVTCGVDAGSQTRNVKCEGGACDPLSPDLMQLQSRACNIPC